MQLNPRLILQSLLGGLILSSSDLTTNTLPLIGEAGTGLSASNSLLNRLAPEMTRRGLFDFPATTPE